MRTHDHLGKYRLVRVIGYGATGEVWAAINTDTDREVAIKLIRSPEPEVRRRLLREARAIGRLVHPNIVQILDRGETEDGTPFLVMQLLEGETVADRLRREHTLPQEVAAGIALSVARALRAAHEKEIVHRDLKPENIFLHREADTDDPIVKVVDFGVSKLSVDNEGMTAPGDLLGSPSYMSPEQVRGVGIDGRADIWALGVVLFEMLSGLRPFMGPSAAAVLAQIIKQPIPRVDDIAAGVDHRLADVVAGCLERDPARRIVSALELCRLLQPFAARPKVDPAELREVRPKPASPTATVRMPHARAAELVRDSAPTIRVRPAASDDEDAPTTELPGRAARRPAHDDEDAPTTELPRVAATPKPAPRACAVTQPLLEGPAQGGSVEPNAPAELRVRRTAVFLSLSGLLIALLMLALNLGHDGCSGPSDVPTMDAESTTRTQG